MSLIQTLMMVGMLGGVIYVSNRMIVYNAENIRKVQDYQKVSVLVNNLRLFTKNQNICQTLFRDSSNQILAIPTTMVDDSQIPIDHYQLPTGTFLTLLSNIGDYQVIKLGLTQVSNLGDFEYPSGGTTYNRRLFQMNIRLTRLDNSMQLPIDLDELPYVYLLIDKTSPYRVAHCSSNIDFSDEGMTKLSGGPLEVSAETDCTINGNAGVACPVAAPSGGGSWGACFLTADAWVSNSGGAFKFCQAYLPGFIQTNISAGDRGTCKGRCIR